MKTTPPTPARTPARTHHLHARRGFSLLEMMLVVLIMGILMGVVVISFGGQTARVERTATIAKMKQIQQALIGYSNQYGTYPPTELGLDPLAKGITKDLERVPKDEWGNFYYYQFPSAENNPERPFDLKSLGRDKQLNTPDDIDIWTVYEGK
ncbi:MAG: type II secretion system protein GspG [bacterium]